jgi:purine-binding chemotaxis protein CheW
VPELSELLDEFFFQPDEDPGPLFELGTPAEPVPAAADEAPQEFLAFTLEGETYGVPVISLREIVRVPPLTEVPRADRALMGVMNLRGEVLPVYDIKPALHLSPEEGPPGRPSGPPPRSARVLVIRSDEGDAGLWVDSVTGVMRLRPSTIEPPPPGVVRGERDCVVGLGRHGNHLLILIDVDLALA